MREVILGAYLWTILPLLVGAFLLLFGLPYWWRHYRPADQEGLRAWLPGLLLFAGLVALAAFARP